MQHLPKLQQIAIEQAAKGGVSGQLREWPELQKAFRNLNLPYNGDMDGFEMRQLARKVMDGQANR